MIAVAVIQAVNNPGSGNFIKIVQQPGISLRPLSQRKHLDVKGFPGQRSPGNIYVFAQLGLQVVHNPVVCSRGRGQHSHIGKLFPDDLSDLSVIQTEFMPPV